MSGNVTEWCNDWWKRDYTISPVTDPAGPTTGNYRVIRGGDWNYYASTCRTAYRDNELPAFLSGYTGFRVAQTFGITGEGEGEG